MGRPFRALLLKYSQLRVDFWGAIEDFVCDRYSAALDLQSALLPKELSQFEQDLAGMCRTFEQRLDREQKYHETQLKEFDNLVRRVRHASLIEQMELWPGDTDEEDWAALNAEGEEDGTQN